MATRIIIRDITTGEAVRTWDQPGGRRKSKEIAQQYLTHPADKIVQEGNTVEVFKVIGG